MSQQPTVNPADITAIVGGYHGAPYDVLGPHTVTVAGQPCLAIRAFRPLDDQVFVLALTDGQRYPMQRIDEAGFFELVLPGVEQPFAYRLLVLDPAGAAHELEDPYRFPFYLTEFDMYLHNEGNFVYSYDKLGAHVHTVDGVQGVTFAVWAPNAQRVSVIGPFNGWDNRTHAMQLHDKFGIWEIFIPNLPEGMDYKYSVKSRLLGYEIDKADPYAFYADLRPSTSSRIWNIDQFAWQDDEWIAKRTERQALDKPLNIYEVHLASWKRIPENNGFLSYRDLAHQLVAYAQEMGYTHLELLPITEHPFDGSWGYQTTGYFAPTSRFGTPADFQYFVDYCHQHGIGVLLDRVPAHFPKDAHGLAFFDGTHLYEHSDPRLRRTCGLGHQDFQFWPQRGAQFSAEQCGFLVEEISPGRSARRRRGLNAVSRSIAASRASGCPTDMAGAKTWKPLTLSGALMN